jgi:hypothetical protein
VTRGAAEAEKIVDDIMTAGFTDEEKRMTLDELIRYEFKRRHEAMRKEGEEMIARFQEKGRSARRQIEAM